jgi:NitT/TauT family transport system permease protein
MNRYRGGRPGQKLPQYARPRPASVLGLGSRMWSLLLVVCLIALVEGLTRSGTIGSFTLVPFSTMAATAGGLLSDGEFVRTTLLPTVELVVTSFVVSVVIGVGWAYGMWRSSWWRRAFEPYLGVYYAVPTFALYPIFVVVFGIGPVPILIISVAFSTVAVITNSLNGFCSVPTVVAKLSTALRMTSAQHLVRILLPAALPNIAIGVRLALAYSIVSVLATEFILSSSGLGHFVSYSYTNFDIANMYAAILMICVAALGANLLIARVLRRFDWRRY